MTKALAEEGPSFIVAKVDPVDDETETEGAPSRIKERSFDQRQNKYMFAMHVEQLEKIEIVVNMIGK